MLLVPTYGLPWSHPMRKQWRDRLGDPVTQSIIRIYLLMTIPLMLICLFFAAADPISFMYVIQDISVINKLGLAVCLAFLFSILSFYPKSGNLSVKDLVRATNKLLSLTDSDLSKLEWEQLTTLANNKLRALAMVCQHTMKTEVNPYTPAYQGSLSEFENAHYILWQQGLINQPKESFFE